MDMPRPFPLNDHDIDHRLTRSELVSVEDIKHVSHDIMPPDRPAYFRISYSRDGDWVILTDGENAWFWNDPTATTQDYRSGVWSIWTLVDRGTDMSTRMLSVRQVACIMEQYFNNKT